ncbi:MAG: hypothetical protein K2Q14_05040 [Gammaproteobacteria bacterium]|nr:hypothetical protein [Gammaproteobacteria bacterium]
MDEKNAGFILVTVMSFLLLLSLLALGTMEITLLLTKQVHAQWQYWQLSAVASQANQELVNRLLQAKSVGCLSIYRWDDRYWKQTADNWNVTSCDKNNMNSQSHSVVEVIPTGLCSRSKDNSQISLEILRITTQTNTDQGKLIRIQSTMMQPTKIVKFCTNFINESNASLQSRRIE